MSTAGDAPPPPSSSPAAATRPSADAADFTHNPGSYEELHRKCKDVFPVLFDGAKVMVQKGLSNHFQISHTLSMSTQPAQSSYRFGATYVGTKQVSATEAFPVLLGDTDFNGNVSATILHRFGQRLQCKVQSQVSEGKLAVCQGSAEWRGRVSTSALTVANADLVHESGIVVAHYLRRVMPRLDVGVELLYQYGAQVPGKRMTALSYSARYNGEQCTAAATVSNSSLHASYYHKQTDDLQLGVEWETNMRMQESVASLAYQVELAQANATIKATVDSQWTIGCLFEKRLAPLPFTLALSGYLNQPKQLTRVGIGLVIG